MRNFLTAMCGIALYATEIALYATEIALYATEIALEEISLLQTFLYCRHFDVVLMSTAHCREMGTRITSRTHVIDD